jgi:hypothetical protein
VGDLLEWCGAGFQTVDRCANCRRVPKQPFRVVTSRLLEKVRVLHVRRSAMAFSKRKKLGIAEMAAC